MSGEKGELFQHDSVFFDPLSFFSHRSGGQQGLDSETAPFAGFADFGSLLTKSFNSTSSIFQEAFGSDEPTASAQAVSFASGDGGRMPVTANSSVSSLSTEAAGEEDCYKNEKNEEMELQQQQQQEEENKEGKKDEDVDDGDDDDKAKKVVKARKKGEKRQRDQPRFAFMTRSQVDHLEDGYRWRKYGQKAVKNSPFPRSYYRCTTQKCAVKKRVERSYQDPSVVITTYEGQHTHYYPANARGSSHLLASPPASGPSLHHHDLLLHSLTPPLQQQLHFPADYDLLLLQDIYTSIINSNQA